MDELEQFLKSIKVNLDAEEDDSTGRGLQELGNSTGANNGHTPEYRRESALERETLTESMLRHDLLAPHVVQFSLSDYNSRGKLRRAFAGFLVIALSVTGLFRFSRLVLKLSRDETLDIEYKMEAVSVNLLATTESNNLSEENTGTKL